jgi:hypothetical protein
MTGATNELVNHGRGLQTLRWYSCIECRERSLMSKKAQRTITVKGRHGWTLARTCAAIGSQMRKTNLEADIRVVKDGKNTRSDLLQNLRC